MVVILPQVVALSRAAFIAVGDPLPPELNAPAVEKLFMTFDYGSRHDRQVLDLDLSDEAADEVLQFLQKRVGS